MPTETKRNASRDGCHLTGLEANLVLFAFDKIFGVNEQGLLTDIAAIRRYGYAPEAAQEIRDRLFVAHDHPDER